jgi:hypothetical protein
MSTIGNVTSLFNPTQGDEYLSENLLHFKPISAHIFAGISFATTSLYQSGSSTTLSGRAVRNLAHLIAASCFLLNSFVAIAEAAGSLALALILSTAHAINGANSQLLQKICVKTWGYSLHSFSILGIQLYYIYQKTFSGYLTSNSLITHGSHLLSAAGAQLSFGRLFDHIAARAPASQESSSFATLRTIRVFTENGHHTLYDLISSIQSDFGQLDVLEELRGHVQNSSLFSNFIQQHPIHQTVLQDLTLHNLGQDDYTARLSAMTSDFLQFSRAANPDGQNEAVLILNTTTQEVSSQQQLKEQIKTAFKELHASDTLASYLSETGNSQEGKDALEGFFPHIYIPLAHYAELKELEAEENSCPSQFASNNLRQYNERHEEIAEARALFSKLSTDEKSILVKKLLQGSSFAFKAQGEEAAVSIEVQKQIDELFSKIGKLAGALHQGTLMSQATLNIANLNASSQNLFQQACMEAAAELTP